MNNIQFIFSIILIALISYLGCVSNNTTRIYYYTAQPRVEYKTKIIPIHIHIKFSEEERRQIILAFNNWNYALNGYLEFKIVEEPFDMEMEKIRSAVNGKSYLVIRLDSDSELIPQSNGKITLAFVNMIGGTLIHIMPENIYKFKLELYKVVLHEIGHALGVKHYKNGLMLPNYNKESFTCIDIQTIIKVAEYNNFDWQKMNYCRVSIK